MSVQAVIPPSISEKMPPAAGMRWFGPDDPVTIEQIRRTPGVREVITALHHIKPGEVWTKKEIARRKIEIEFKPNPNAPKSLSGVKLYEWHQRHSEPTGLTWSTVESLVFSEAIKNGKDPAERDRHIENYKRSLQNLGAFGIKNVMGNFMLVADWTRTGFTELLDGSIAFEYDHTKFAMFDIFMLRRHGDPENFIKYFEDNSYELDEIQAATRMWKKEYRDFPDKQTALQKMIIAGLPGAQQGFTLEDFRKAVKQYEGMTVADLRENIRYFMDAVVPVARENGINLCSHPDDPAFTPFMGTPRAVGDLEGYKYLLKQGCGVGLCPGSLMPNRANADMAAMVYELAEYGREHGNHGKGMTIAEIFPHVHLRPIEMTGPKSFREGHHVNNLDTLLPVIHALVDVGWEGVYRPDHAPTSVHGKGKNGYDGIGRGFGAQVLQTAFRAATEMKALRTVFARAATNTVLAEMKALLPEGATLTEEFTRRVEEKVSDRIREAAITHMREQLLRQSDYFRGEYKTDGRPSGPPTPPPPTVQ